MNLLRLSKARKAALTTMLVALLTGLSATSSEAAVWYLHVGNAGGTNYDNPAFWWSTPTGGTNPSSMSSLDTYDTNGYLARTPNSGAPTTFSGGTLLVSTPAGGGPNGQLAFTGLSATITNLGIAASGGTFSQAYAGTTTVKGTNFTLDGALSASNNGVAVRKTVINYTNLSGAGNMMLTGGGSGYDLSFGNATAYTGTITMVGATVGQLGTTSLDFGSSFASGGGLDIGSGVTVLGFGTILDPINVSFTSLVINGVTIGASLTPYSYGTLRAGTYNGVNGSLIFTEAGGLGSITVVPEPSTWLLFGAAGVFLVLVKARGSIRRRRAMIGA